MPAPPLWRDAWAWGCALAVIPIVLHSLGAPLGEPVAEDFDFLHRALFFRFTLLDGGGSNSFWRPLAHQTYYATLSSLILDHPGLLASLHVALLALASVLFYRAFRRGWPAPWAAAIATFPLLSESTRTLVSWPSHFVDLGVWLFTAVVLHETAARRQWSALAALLAALLCKEVALVAALLAPWVPSIGPRGRRERLRWAAAMGALAISWGTAYWIVRQRAGLHLPHDLETSAATIGTPLAARVAWAAGNSLRAYLSLPFTPVAREGPLVMAAVALTVLAFALGLVGARQRGVLLRSRALVAWGLGWFLAASATMAPIFPLWAPNRSGYASLGCGAVAAPLFGAAHSGLLASLVTLRLVAFALSPAPPASVAPMAPETGAFLDFEQLVRLQHLMRDTRRALMTRYPTLPEHATVGLDYVPRHAAYAFGGSQSLQVWYRDSTLHWVNSSEFMAHPEMPLAAIAEFEAQRQPQITLVEPEAMRSFIRALAELRRRRQDSALVYLGRADSLQRDPNADLFAGQVAGKRAEALAYSGAFEAAEHEARRGIALWPQNVYAHFAPSSPPPGFIDRVLANGLQVTIVPDSSLPIVSTRIWYHVGAANEAPNTRGFAHLFEHLMFGGTPTHAKGVWEAHHHRFGGIENAHTSWDETTYESDIPPAGFHEVLVMEADRMVNLSLDAALLENEKRIVTEELRASIENDPYDRMLTAALKSLCGDHPYAVTPLGTKEDVVAATLEHARAFYARYYRPRNAHLVIVGPVDGPGTLADVERIFGAIPAGGETPPDVPSLWGWKFPERIRLEEDLPPAEVAVLVYPLPPPDSEDDVALGVMEEFLTGGKVDPFREDLVRSRHQTLEAGIQVLGLRRGGVLCFYSAVLPYRREGGQFDVMNETMRKLERKEWLTEARLAGARRKMLRAIEQQRYRAGERADALASSRWWRGNAALAFTRADRVATVSRADVARAFDRYVTNARPVAVYIQPEKVPIMLQLFGWMLPLVMR